MLITDVTYRTFQDRYDLFLNDMAIMDHVESFQNCSVEIYRVIYW